MRSNVVLETRSLSMHFGGVVAVEILEEGSHASANIGFGIQTKIDRVPRTLGTIKLPRLVNLLHSSGCSAQLHTQYGFESHSRDQKDKANIVPQTIRRQVPTNNSGRIGTHRPNSEEDKTQKSKFLCRQRPPYWVTALGLPKCWVMCVGYPLIVSNDGHMFSGGNSHQH